MGANYPNERVGTFTAFYRTVQRDESTRHAWPQAQLQHGHPTQLSQMALPYCGVATQGRGIDRLRTHRDGHTTPARSQRAVLSPLQSLPIPPPSALPLRITATSTILAATANKRFDCCVSANEGLLHRRKLQQDGSGG
jgi:hypothetical protein